MSGLTKKYQFQETEKKWQEFWEENKIYKWDSAANREDTYVIDTPPPTVSGMLHMGHVFSYVQADFIARYQRMKGKTIYYPMGFDDNGLPTERLVEKVKKIKGSKIARPEFVSLCKEVSQTARKEFRELFTSIALSVDWDEEYNTISDQTRQISQMSFLDLYHKNLTELKLEPCYWDVIDQTALSQVDIEDKELTSHMNYIPFGLENSQNTITIATTRPELIPACVALFVHPEDEKYQHLIGTNAITSLFEVKIPILGDVNVSIEKGTGAVMCCTFGDIMDVMWWKQHKLDSRIILNKYGKIKDVFNKESNDYDSDIESTIEQNANISNYKKYYTDIIGKKVVDARSHIIEKLREHNLLIKQEELTHPVKCAERSGSPIEIILTKQWFIKILDQKETLLKKAAEINWHPKYMKSRIDQWINGLSYDWCISRQRFFGVPFPIWYLFDHDKLKAGLPLGSGEPSRLQQYIQSLGEPDKYIVAKKEDLPIDPCNIAKHEKVFEKEGYKLHQISGIYYLTDQDGKEWIIRPEQDVMDTWATSSVSPQISSQSITKDYTLGNYEQRHQKLFPADLRPQAHEIIRSWAFYTIVKAQLHENTIPWKNIMISGWCLASDKTKMSKSKGNVVTPINLINEKGTDIVRYWAANSSLGSDTAYSEDVLSIGKKLINKLWNASKFCMIHIDNIKKDISSPKTDIDNNYICYTTDLWLLSQLADTIEKCEAAFEQYEYAKAIEHIEFFFWHDFCDNYLEIIKARAYGDIDNLRNYNPDITQEEVNKGKISSSHTIFHSLETILRLLAPFIPHITEELYSIIFPNNLGRSIHTENTWPQISQYPHIGSSIIQGKFILDVMELVRKEKSNHSLSLKTEIKSLEIYKNNNLMKINDDIISDLASVCNAREITIATKDIENINISLDFGDDVNLKVTG